MHLGPAKNCTITTLGVMRFHSGEVGEVSQHYIGKNNREYARTTPLLGWRPENHVCTTAATLACADDHNSHVVAMRAGAEHAHEAVYFFRQVGGSTRPGVEGSDRLVGSVWYELYMPQLIWPGHAGPRKGLEKRRQATTDMHAGPCPGLQTRCSQSIQWARRRGPPCSQGLRGSKPSTKSGT